MIVEKHIKPTSIQEAYDLLKKTDKAVILGGGLFLRLQKKTIPLLIDCEQLISNHIDGEDEIHIGAMASLRDIELSTILPQCLKDSVMQISGVGTRNLATIGGSICGRYPFSDINTALVALDATLVFHKSGQVPMRFFNEKGLKEKDILLEVYFTLPKFSRSAYYKKVYTDFSIVNLSVVNHTVAVGARPMRPVLLENVDYSLSPQEILKDIEFGDDFKASGAYRRALAETKLDDIIKSMGGHHD